MTAVNALPSVAPGDAAVPAPTFARVSVVIPVYNERGTLHELYAGLCQTLPGVARSFEVLFVDDGSTDGSRGLLEHLAEADGRVRVLSLRTNQGKAAALSVGFAHVTGEVVITMDADLQIGRAHV